MSKKINTNNATFSKKRVAKACLNTPQYAFKTIKVKIRPKKVMDTVQSPQPKQLNLLEFLLKIF
jgi:hypothetical protein